MSGSAYELLRLIKQHTAQDGYLGPQIGKVTALQPLTIMLGGSTIRLQPKHLVMTNSVGALEVGNEVVLLPSANNQKYFVIARVVMT